MSEQRAQLRDALSARLREARSDQSWSRLVEAGIVGLRVPGRLGGLALSIAEAEPVFDVLGEQCLASSYLETSIVAAGLLNHAREEAAPALLERIASGARVAVAGLEPEFERVQAAREQGAWKLDGRALIVLDACDADALVVIADHEGALKVFLVDIVAPGLTRRAVPTVDGRMAGDLQFQHVHATHLDVDCAAIDLVCDEAIACIALEAAGLMRRMVRDTVAYVKQREQFGQKLGAFQVVQHRLVDMNIQARRASAIARKAMASLNGDEATRQRVVSAAKVTICRAGRFVGQNAVQLHGGMGMTAELAIGRCFKRLTVIEAQLGSADYHLRRFQRTRALFN